jgi:hypothetical protein
VPMAARRIVVFKTQYAQGVITTTNFSTFQPSHLIKHTSMLRKDVQVSRDIYSSKFDEVCGKLRRDLEDRVSHRVLKTT